MNWKYYQPEDRKSTTLYLTSDEYRQKSPEKDYLEVSEL